MDIPEHSGPSSRALCQASEDRPRWSVEVPSRESHSLWLEKGDRKEAKKIRAGHRSSGRKLLIFLRG